MAKFTAPYGTDGQHVIGPAMHLGYHYMTAHMVSRGCFAQQILDACAAAADEGAPKDAISRRENGGWYRRGDVTDARTRQLLDAYAAALTQYATELKRERAAGR